MPIAQLPPVLNSLAQPLLDALRKDPAGALLIALAVLLVLTGLVLFLLVRLVLMGNRQARLLRGTDGKDVQRMLIDHVGTMQNLARQVERASHYGERNTATLQQCLQRVGVVRFDAFADL
ncbi:MAG: DUF4446 family protein, partial [Oxalobacteraceae bacterium]